MNVRSAALVLAFLGAAESSAFAFCRTTTSEQPANYDPSDGEGCWNKPDTKGRPALPLWWRNACIGYSIHRAGSRRVSADDAARAINQAFTRWTGASCQSNAHGGSRASIDVRYLGEVDCGKVEFNEYGGPNQNVITFRDAGEAWPYNKEDGVLGIAKAFFNPSTGEIYNADMEINMADMDPLVVREDDEVPPGSYDLLSILTHEAGHFFGIGHSEIRGATMAARYDSGARNTAIRNLSPDDVLAICTVYNPDGNRAVLNGKVYMTPECDPTPRNGYTSACKERPGCSASRVRRPPPIESPFAWAGALGALALLGRRRRTRR